MGPRAAIIVVHPTILVKVLRGPVPDHNQPVQILYRSKWTQPATPPPYVTVDPSRKK